MAGRSDIEAGRAHIWLYVKNSALVKGLNDASARLKGLGTSIMGVGGALTGMGAAIVTPLVGAVAQFSAMGSELADMSGRTGMAVGSLAELKFAAEQSGAGIEDVEKAIMRMQKGGVKGTFDEVAARIAAIKDPAERTRQAIEVWGKSGTKLLPMIENLEAMRQEARDLGLVPTEEAVSMADEIGDAWDKVQSVIKATIFNVGAAVAPVLLPVLDTTKNIAAWFNRWAKENAAIIRTVFMIGAGIGGAGLAVTAIGAAIFGVGAALGGAATVVTTLAGVLGALTSPVALLVGAIAAGVFAWARFTSSGRAAVQGLIDFAMPLIDTLRSTLSGIGDALQAGDLALAGQIAVTGLRLVFAQGVSQIADLLGGTLGDTIGAIGGQIAQGDIAGAWQTVVSTMARIWADFSAGVVKVFTQAATAVATAWQGTVKSISDFLLDASSQGGVMGKVASAILGTDMAAEQKKADELNRQLGLAPQNITADAKRIAGQQIDSLAAPIKDFLDGISRAAEDQAAEADTTFRSRIAGRGGKRNSDIAQEQLQRELDELRRQAAAAKEAAQSKRPDAAGGTVAEIKSAAAVTGFSAAALLAAGQGGGGLADVAKNTRDMLREAREQKKLLAKIADKEGAIAE